MLDGLMFEARFESRAPIRRLDHDSWVNALERLWRGRNRFYPIPNTARGPDRHSCKPIFDNRAYGGCLEPTGCRAHLRVDRTHGSPPGSLIPRTLWVRNSRAYHTMESPNRFSHCSHRFLWALLLFPVSSGDGRCDAAGL